MRTANLLSALPIILAVLSPLVSSTPTPHGFKAGDIVSLAKRSPAPYPTPLPHYDPEDLDHLEKRSLPDDNDDEEHSGGLVKRSPLPHYDPEEPDHLEKRSLPDDEDADDHSGNLMKRSLLPQEGPGALNHLEKRSPLEGHSRLRKRQDDSEWEDVGSESESEGESGGKKSGGKGNTWANTRDKALKAIVEPPRFRHPAGAGKPLKKGHPKLLAEMRTKVLEAITELYFAYQRAQNGQDPRGSDPRKVKGIANKAATVVTATKNSVKMNAAEMVGGTEAREETKAVQQGRKPKSKNTGTSRSTPTSDSDEEGPNLQKRSFLSDESHDATEED